VLRTRAGYAGGTLANPTYERSGDHAEAIQIDFDPAQVSYARLLETFFSSRHVCRSQTWQRIRSVVFVHSDSQKKIANEALAARRAENKEVHAEIREAGTFHIAEDKNQKYMLRAEPELWREFTAMYPDERDIVNSTAAARINGLIGLSRRAVSEEEMRSFGLSPQAAAFLRRQLDFVPAK